MEVHHPHHPTHKKKWSEYIIEFVMLFAAVTLGFLAENLREHQIMNHRVEQNKIAILKDLQTQMRSAAGKLDFERAAELRDIIFEIKASL